MADPMSVEEIGVVVDQLIRRHRDERPRLDTIAAYRAIRVCDIYIPREATTEYRLLVEMSKFDVLGIVENAVAQNLYVDGYRPRAASGRAPSAENSPVWDEVWQPNRLDARQAQLFRPAIRYGYSYATVLPGNPAPVVTPYSPRKLTALYDDPVNDEWPRLAMVVRRSPMVQPPAGSDPLAAPEVKRGAQLKVYDADHIYTVTRSTNGDRWELDPNIQRHGLGVCPVVRFLDSYGEDDFDDDLELPPGKLEPLLPAQRQLNQTTHGLLITQHHQAYRQRWATGMEIERDANGNPVTPWNARVNAVWQNESPDGRFGEFEASDLSNYLDSRDKSMLYISARAQVPPQNILVGAGISNISAEALVALESGHRHDIDEHKTSFGESIEQMLRLAGLAMGDDETWDDTSAQVVWRDTTPRSLSQIADALGKMATQLGIPVQALWERIPEVTDDDLVRWRAMATEDELMRELSGMLNDDNPEPQEGAGAVAGVESADPGA